MKLKYRVFTIVIIACFCLGVNVYSFAANLAESNRFADFSVVIDAGHGGMDGGVMGRTTRIPEAPINLSVARKLKKCFEANGIRVVMTRTDDSELSDDASSGRWKRRDMELRGEIIRNSGADAMISIHMNAFPDKTSRGGQVFYQPGSEESRRLAETIQSGIRNMDRDNTRLAKPGDYFIVKQAEIPSVLVECGFLSHPGEELQLIDENYQKKMAWCIYNSVISYFAKGDNAKKRR